MGGLKGIVIFCRIKFCSGPVYRPSTKGRRPVFGFIFFVIPSGKRTRGVRAAWRRRRRTVQYHSQFIVVDSREFASVYVLGNGVGSFFSSTFTGPTEQRSNVVVSFRRRSICPTLTRRTRAPRLSASDLYAKKLIC